MKALIIEDEVLNYNDLCDMLSRAYPEMEISRQVSSLVEMERKMLCQHNYDVVYCDIRLEDGLCFSVLEQLEISVPIIFTTAYSEFALDAFDSNGIAYLLKPIKQEALIKATDKALAISEKRKRECEDADWSLSSSLQAFLSSLKAQVQPSSVHYLKARTIDGIYIIDVAEVSHFLLEDGQVNAMMNNGNKHKVDYSLDMLMQKLDPMQFFRANRQYIVSRKAISRISTWDNRRLLIKLFKYPDEQIFVSRDNAGSLDKWIEK